MKPHLYKTWPTVDHDGYGRLWGREWAAVAWMAGELRERRRLMFAVSGMAEEKRGGLDVC